MCSTVRRNVAAAVLLIAIMLAGGCLRRSPLDRERPATLSSDAVTRHAEMAWMRFTKMHPAAENPALMARLTDILDRLTRVTRSRNMPWQIYVYTDGPVNAFILPPANIAVHADICTILESDSERAALLAHLLGHADAVHGTERLGKLLAAGGYKPEETELESSAIEKAVQTAYTGFAADGEKETFGVRHEMVADSLAVLYLIESGYDPKGLITGWERLARAKPEMPLFLQVHPMTLQRRGKLNKIIADNPSLR